MKNNLGQILLTVLVVVIVFGLVHFTLQSYEVDGTSMKSNFENGQRVLVEKVTYRFHSPHRGDVIVFWPPESASRGEPFIKRVIGEPGDKIEIEDGKIYVNDWLLQETPSFSPMPTSNNCSLTVPDNRYFVLGDNRAGSYDSPDWGSDPEDMTVAREDIIGRVWLRYWPLGDLGFSPSYSYTYA
jgi:signal peptidase I